MRIRNSKAMVSSQKGYRPTVLRKVKTRASLHNLVYPELTVELFETVEDLPRSLALPLSVSEEYSHFHCWRL